MSKLLYVLEDHFAAVADEREGSLSGSVSRGLGALFAIMGDMFHSSVASRRF